MFDAVNAYSHRKIVHLRLWEALQLGNYQVNTTHDDFKFEDVYFSRFATEPKAFEK